MKRALRQINPSYALDPDKTYIKVVHDTTIVSESLTDALLKKSIGEESLLSNPSVELHHADLENQVEGLDIPNIKNCIDHLSATLISTFRQQTDEFWDLNGLSIPLELQDSLTHEILKALAESVFLIEKVYQIDSMYPNLKQSITAHFSKKLKGLYNKDTHPSMVTILFFANQENDRPVPFSTLNLIDFTLNKFKCTSYPSTDAVTIQAKVDQDVKSIPLSDIFQESDLLTIKSAYQNTLRLFWQKNYSSYQVLAKFSYLRALFKQQNSEYMLSEKGFTLACQAALHINEEEIKQLDAINLMEPSELKALFVNNPLDRSMLVPNHLEISPFIVNNQAAVDIVKIRNLRTNDLLIYIPGYTPSFVEGKDGRMLIHWIFHQAQLSQTNFSAIALHFFRSSRLINPSKIDAFLYGDYVAQEGPLREETSQMDIFAFITNRQCLRTVSDLNANSNSLPLDINSIPDYQSTDAAIFTTIAAAIEFIPYLLPNIHNTSSNLHELFPSPYQTASELMKQGIQEKLQLDVDPDKTFIRFSLHETGPIYYDPTLPPVSTGQEASTTVQSLTEAALHNYRVGYSPFGFTTTIYQDLSGRGEYRSSDQLLNISPQVVQEIVQQADLDTLHKDKLNAFWAAHTDRVKYFLKYRYLQQALEAYHNRTLSQENFKIVAEAALYSLALEEEEATSFINPNLRIESLRVASYQSTDMFILRDISQQQALLYIAGSQEPFSVFATHADCINILEGKAKNDPIWQKMLVSHFSMDVQDSVLNTLQRTSPSTNFSLGSLPTFSSQPPRAVRIQSIQTSLFEVMQKNIQERSYLDANVLITSDREVMLKHFLNIAKSIEIALLAPSMAFPILNWVVLAALIAETSLNLYIASNGDTVQERHQAAIDVGFSIVESLLVAFLRVRSLKFSKSQNLSSTAQATKSRPLIRTMTRENSNMISSLRKDLTSNEMFFNTSESMRVWNISAKNHRFNYLDAKAWFLDENFLLFTGKTDQAKHLIISSHGGYFPGNTITKVPARTELIVLGPHGWELVDPTTSNIAKRTVLAYGVINENSALPAQGALLSPLLSGSSRTPSKIIDAKTLAGTSVPGYIKNYSLSKFQKFEAGEESYVDIIHIVNRSRNPAPTIYEIGLKPVDVLTIRNRFWSLEPSLQDVFTSLENHGIHYDRITLSFCRANAFRSMFNLAPSHRPPTF